MTERGGNGTDSRAGLVGRLKRSVRPSGASLFLRKQVQFFFSFFEQDYKYAVNEESKPRFLSGTDVRTNRSLLTVSDTSNCLCKTERLLTDVKLRLFTLQFHFCPFTA